MQRSADTQVPEEDVAGEGQEQGEDGEGDTQPAKKPALSSGFSFRPSPLQKATQGLILRQSTLTPPSTSGTPHAKPLILFRPINH